MLPSHLCWLLCLEEACRKAAISSPACQGSKGSWGTSIPLKGPHAHGVVIALLVTHAVPQATTLQGGTGLLEGPRPIWWLEVSIQLES